MAAAAALLKTPTGFLHAAGPKNIEEVRKMPLPEGYDVRPFIEAPELAAAYATAQLAIGRSGGTLAEYAVFRLPSVLIPLPSSADAHQLHNAEEFVNMGAATLLQEADASPQALAAAIGTWLSDEPRRLKAGEALADWDLPNATATITDLVMGAAR